MVRNPSRVVAALLAVILGIGALCRIWGLDFGLPYTQARPDETYIIDVARALLSGTAPPRHYDYPWLYMGLVSVLYIAYYLLGAALGTFHSLSDMITSWRTHWEPFFLLSRALSAGFGTATVWVVFRIGRRLWDEWTGLLAALFLSLAFLHARDSHFGTTDVATVFFIVWAIDLLIAAHHERRGARFAAAGLIAGLAAATKYSALLLAVPITASYVLHVMNGSRGQAERDRRVLVFGAAFLAGFSIGVPFLFTDAGHFVAAMQLLWDSMRVGNQGLDPGSGYAFHLALSLRHGLGLPLLVTGIAGALLIAWREPQVAALLLSFPFTYYLVAGGVRNLFVRYAVPLVPFLCLSGARAVSLLAARSCVLWSSAPAGRDVPGWVGLLVGAAIVAPSARAIWRFDQVISRTDNRVMVARWFATNVPSGCSVAQSGTRFGYVQFDPQLEYRVLSWDPVRNVFLSDGQPVTSPPDWVLVQDSPIPSATQPIVNEWLRQDFVLVQRFRALSSTDGHVYDLQDAFFVPFARFVGTERPGPSFSVFRNKLAPNCETRRPSSDQAGRSSRPPSPEQGARLTFAFLLRIVAGSRPRRLQRARDRCYLSRNASARFWII